MTKHQVKDRKGTVLTVHSKAQADYWVGLGYSLVEETKPAAKTTSRKSSAKPENK